MPTVWSILLAVRTCGLLLLWINLTSSREPELPFCGFRWTFQCQCLSDVQVKWGWSLGYFHYVLFEVPLYTITSTGEIRLSLPVHSMPCTTAYTGLGFDVGWLVIDWLIDWLMCSIQVKTVRKDIKKSSNKPQKSLSEGGSFSFLRIPRTPRLPWNRKQSLCSESSVPRAVGRGQWQLTAWSGSRDLRQAGASLVFLLDWSQGMSPWFIPNSTCEKVPPGALRVRGLSFLLPLFLPLHLHWLHRRSSCCDSRQTTQ